MYYLLYISPQRLPHQVFFLPVYPFVFTFPFIEFPPFVILHLLLFCFHLVVYPIKSPLFLLMSTIMFFFSVFLFLDSFVPFTLLIVSCRAFVLSHFHQHEPPCEVLFFSRLIHPLPLFIAPPSPASHSFYYHALFTPSSASVSSLIATCFYIFLFFSPVTPNFVTSILNTQVVSSIF